MANRRSNVASVYQCLSFAVGEKLKGIRCQKIEMRKFHYFSIFRLSPTNSFAISNEKSSFSDFPHFAFGVDFLREFTAFPETANNCVCF